MKTYKVKIPATVSITWSQELVENKDNFYIRLKPHINLSGVKGADSLTRVQHNGVSRYVLTKAQNEIMRQIKLDNEFKKTIKTAIKGTSTPTQPVQVKTPISTLPRVQQTTAEERALGEWMRKQQEQQEREDRRALYEDAKRLAEKDPEAAQLLYGRKDKVE